MEAPALTVASTPRAGTHMLCDMLDQIGITSTWHPAPDGTVTVRVVHSATNALPGGPVFRLWRRNRWAQARSWIAAEIADVYDGPVGVDVDALVDERTVLARLVDIIDRAEELDRLPGIVGRTSYEDVVADPVAAVAAICQHLGRPVPDRPLWPRTQRSGVNPWT